MDKLIEISMSLVVALTIYVGFKALGDINDGRIETVVSQIVNNRAIASERGLK